MPKIMGLEEQRNAFNEIKILLKEIEEINLFLSIPNNTGNYEISFVPDELGVQYLDSVVDSIDNEDNEETEKGKGRKGKSRKSKLCSASFLCPDTHIVKNYVLLSKKEKVDRIRILSREYNIFLDASDEKIIDQFKEDMM